MNISGIIRGLWITLSHLVTTYTEDIRKGKKRYRTEQGIEERRNSDVQGIFTIQYPEEKMPVPENFRYIPFLVYDEGPDHEKNIRCTSCGICAKVCPPQCIWITRSVDPNTGKPIPTPAKFAIDVDICMNCGFCAEYCPFDAIKMDHDYEIASYNRMQDHIFDLSKLAKPASYYKKIRPTYAAQEETEKAEKEAAKAKKPEPAAS